MLIVKMKCAAPTNLLGWRPVRFTVRFTLGHRPVNGERAYGKPTRFTLGEVCVKLVDVWGLTERELAYIVSMRPGDAPFVNEDLHVTRRP